MKKYFVICLLIFALSHTACSQALDYNSLNSLVKTVSDTQVKTSQETQVAKNADNIASQINLINSKLTANDDNVKKAFLEFVSAACTKEDADKAKASIDFISQANNLTVSEKSSKVADFILNYTNKMDGDKDNLIKNLLNANATQKEDIKTSYNSLKEAAKSYIDISKDCQNLLANIAKNPSNALSMLKEINSLKETVNILSSDIKAINSLSSEISTFAQSAAINLK